MNIFAKASFFLPLTPITVNSATGKDTGTKGEDPLKHAPHLALRSWGDKRVKRHWLTFECAVKPSRIPERETDF